MFEALTAPWAQQAVAIEPGVDFGDRMKLARINFRLSVLLMTEPYVSSRLLTRWGERGPRRRRVEKFGFSIRQTYGDRKSSPCRRWTRIYFRFTKKTRNLFDSFAPFGFSARVAVRNGCYV